ncbi:MAG TPA: fumarate hydratase [Thermodesulfobacteriota bacterium]|nr:fumarate hydratase [Thermodesulfobacteriota bacterium]
MSSFREISCDTITKTVRKLFLDANTVLGEDVLYAVKKAIAGEESELGRYALGKIEENAKIARETSAPLCQDTGLAVLFVELGQDVHIAGGNFDEAIQRGVREAYRDGFLRKSVCDPLSRKNTGDNTPAIIHTEIVDGNSMKITAMPKGGGSENMSSCTMLLPAAGVEGLKKCIVEKVAQAGSNPCPPVIVGIGIGGSIEKSAILAKKALLRTVGEHNQSDSRLSELEDEILEEINRLGIGPQGYGGGTTALAVHIEMMPCHIASLPVTINIQCHVARHKEAVI